MSTPAIQAALQQMQGMATQAASTQPLSGAQASAAVGQGGFGGELQARFSALTDFSRRLTVRRWLFRRVILICSSMT